MKKYIIIIIKIKLLKLIFFLQESSNNVFLVMEYCNGGDLGDYLNGECKKCNVRKLFNQHIK